MMCGQDMSIKETAHGLFGSLFSLNELFLGGTGIDIQLQEPAYCCAQQVFDQMPHQVSKLDSYDEQGEMSVEVVWDAEVQDRQGVLVQDSLLKQFALGADDSVVKDWVLDKQKQVPIQDSVIWDDDATMAIQEESLADVIWDDGRDSYSSKDEVGPFLGFSEGTPLPVFDEMHLEEVVWDEEIGHHISYHGELLEQLVEGGQFMDSEEIMMEVSLSPSEFIPTDGRVALFSPEAARYGDHLVLDERPSANVVWDDVMLGDCGSWQDSLELEQCDRYPVDEKTKPVLKSPHVASDEISHKVQWHDEQLPNQIAEIASKMEKALSNRGNFDGNTVSLELCINSLVPLQDGTAYADKHVIEGCRCLNVVKSANQVRVLIEKDSGSTMAVEERMIAVKVEWSPTVPFSLHFKLAWLDPNHKIASSVRRQWDPGIRTATAWGQAVFRGAGNVMTQESHEMSLSVIRSSNPVRPKAQAEEHSYTGRLGQQQGIDKIFRTRLGLIPPSGELLTEGDSGEPSTVPLGGDTL